MALNVVKIISDEIDSAKRRIVKFLRLGKDDVQTAYEAMPPGVDASPIKDMKAIYGKTSSNGETVIIGYINEKQISEPGEHRIFATNGQGVEQLHIHLKKNGTAEIGGTGDHLVRYNQLAIAFNQFQAEFNAHVVVFNAHFHTVPNAVPLGPPPVLTLIPNTPSVPSTANIQPAKINELETLP